MRPWSFDHVWSDPAGCFEDLVSSGAVSYVAIRLVQRTAGIVTIEARFAAPPGFESYPDETARMSVLWDQTIVAVPMEDRGRTWRHRYPILRGDHLVAELGGRTPAWPLVFGALCLEFPGDPRRLRWNWALGVDTYCQMVQRHLLAEEFTRRYGSWPVEDTPHGHRSDGKPHPILSPLFRAA